MTALLEAQRLPGLLQRLGTDDRDRGSAAARQVPQYVTWSPKPGGAGAA